MSPTTRHPAPSVICAAACVALALVAGACGGDDPAQSSPAFDSTTASPVTAAPMTAAPATTAEPTTVAPTTAAAPDTAAPTPTDIGQEVTFEFTPGAETIVPIAAQRCTTDEQACLLPLSVQPAQFSGDLVGEVVVQSSISTRGDRMSSVAQLLFSGTLGECGSGTVAIALAGSFRPEGTEGADGSFTWRILDGSGTGDLVGATGGGEGTEGVGPLEGRILCG